MVELSRFLLSRAWVAVVGVAVLAGCGPVEDSRPGKPVAHRQAAFKDILRSFEPMGLLLQKEKFDTKAFQALAAELMTKRDAPWGYFGADTQYPPSKSTPEVWTEKDKFEESRKAFFQATDQLKLAADSGDQAAMAAAHKAVYDTCKQCHKKFKDK